MLDYFGQQFRPYMNRSYIDQDKGFYVYARYKKEDQNPDPDKQYSKNMAILTINVDVLMANHIRV